MQRPSLSPSDELGPIDEDLGIEFGVLRESFARGMESGPGFLDELERMAQYDNELEGETSSITRAFELLKELIGADWQTNSRDYGLSDLSDFLDETETRPLIVSRIGLLAFQLENTSPTSLNRRESAGTSRSIMTQNSRTSQSDEYKSDWEDEEVDEDDVMENTRELPSGQYGVRGSRDRRVSRTRMDQKELDSNEDLTEEPIFSTDRRQEARSSNPAISVVESSRIGAPSMASNLDVYATRVSRYGLDSDGDDDSSYPPSRRYGSAPASAPRSYQPQSQPSPNVLGPPISTGGARVSTSEEPGERRSSSSASGPRRSTTAVPWIRDKKYTLGIKIGSGSFGEVFQCMNHEGKLLAVKKLHIAGQPRAISALVSEIQLMRDFQHNHIVRYIGAAVDEREGVVNIFQEWVPGGSVAHMLKMYGPFPDTVVASYTRQILLGLKFLHENGIIHRDIKGGNVLVHENGTVKLADFGASTRLDSNFNQTQATDTIKGTPYFMAPEVLAESKYGRKGDVWAVGCTMIQMLTGQPPWKDRNLATMVQLHLLLQSWEGPPPYDSHAVRDDCREVLGKCFQRESNLRPSAEELLSYPFLQEVDEMERSWGNQTSGMGDSGELVKQLKAAAAGGHVWGSIDNSEEDLSDLADGAGQQTAHVRRQVSDRQRDKERRAKSKSDGVSEDEGKTGRDDDVDFRDALPPASYGAVPHKHSSPTVNAAHNPFARGASGPSRQSSKTSENSSPVLPHRSFHADADAKDGGGLYASEVTVESQSTSRPSSRETRADAKVSTPKSAPSSAANTPTHNVRTKSPASTASPARDERSMLRVQTSRDRGGPQPQPLKLGRVGSRPNSKEAAAGARGNRGDRGLSSARDSEDVTPGPHGDEDGDDEIEIHVSWTCESCHKTNSGENREYCNWCAKVRVRKIINSVGESGR